MYISCSWNFINRLPLSLISCRESHWEFWVLHFANHVSFVHHSDKTVFRQISESTNRYIWRNFVCVCIQLLLADQEGLSPPLSSWSTSVAWVLLLCSNQEPKLWQNEWKSHLCADSMGQECWSSRKVGKCMFWTGLLHL